MVRTEHPFLLFMLLVAIGVRTVVGAPCCMPSVAAAETHEASPSSHHANHAGHHSSGHEGHEDNSSANPCCSACGPSLPPETSVIADRTSIRELPEPAPIRALETRPPFPAYEARGPPNLS